MDYLGEEIGKLGFGLMRLPKKGEEIDIEQVKEMVDLFLAEGFTYFDTAWAYEGSEEAARQALVERHPRESFQLATKVAPWNNCNSKEEAEAQLDISLERTGAGYFDYYLLHNLGNVRTHFFDDYGMWDWIQRKKEEGLIRHAGFSFHSTAEELDEILTAHPEMEFVQLQINYADWEHPEVQARACYETARKHGKPVIIMEPVKGGMLATPPDSVAEIFRKAEPESSVASWALRFAADLDGIITVLSGMSDMEQLRDNISCLKGFSGLSDSERETLKAAQKAMDEIPLIPCTSCNYCMKVCPLQIGIPGSFTAMNYLTLYGNKKMALNQEEWLVTARGLKHAYDCAQCGTCEEVCPQHIAISKELQKISTKLF